MLWIGIVYLLLGYFVHFVKQLTGSVEGSLRRVRNLLWATGCIEVILFILFVEVFPKKDDIQLIVSTCFILVFAVLALLGINKNYRKFRDLTDKVLYHVSN
ncbi:hypothetical protein QUF84_00160 [Fictibacillus enclensis]|uniref:hypothetical protein n=1 Tax=Fictibacillus enclensis TaxID=1017270 RepID=UPI0025A1D1EF|nr:hypothetical protein [Fictibacillus enclensis]MDM5335709.1 hypothetical protein [Fictibacillus enclensis]